MEAAIPIVSTKLHPPIVRGNVLQRQRLLEALEQVTNHRLTLVCAGPGYGKTTLLSGITALQNPVVWYSLSPTDQDLAVFISYLVEGIRQYQPGFGERVLQLLSVKDGPRISPERVAGELVNSLGRFSGTELIVVLDDYHSADRGQAIRKALDYVLMNLPANAHFVIATRRAPRLSSLPRLRMIGEVNDIGEADLRFTPDEVQELFAQAYGLRPGDEAVGTIFEQTEGWVIALHLAAQSLKAKRGEGGGDLLSSLGASKRRLFEYLAEEVLQRQPSGVQQFLRESSILSTLSAESCDAILRRTDSAAVLDYIEQNNLFAVEVGDGNWRYHHLFRDFLRQQIKREQAEFQELHRHAGAYYESAGKHVQATQHYLAGADYRSAVSLISRVGQTMLCASRFDTLTFWITQIPDRELDEAPDVLLLQAQVLELQGHYDQSMRWLERAAQAFGARKSGIGLSKVLRNKAYVAVWRLGRHAEAISLYSEALDHLGPEDRAERADLLSCLALSYLPAASPTAAREAYEQALKIYEEVGDTEGTLATLINPGTWIHWLGGDFSECLATLHRARALARELGSKHSLAECLGCMSLAMRYLDRCDEAKRYAEEALALSREIGSVRLESMTMSFLGQAFEGGRAPDLDAARRYLQESARLAESEGNERNRIWSLSHEVSVLRRMGDLTEAIKVGNQVLSIAERSTDQWLFAHARMNVGAALITQDHVRAEDLLRLADVGFQRLEDKFNLTCANFWIAVSLLRSRPREALEHFQVSLGLAKANGYGFWFVEEHRPAVPLLVWAIRHTIHPDYCVGLLKDIGPEAADGLRALAEHEDVEVRRIAAEPLRHLKGRNKEPELGSEAVPVGQSSSPSERGGDPSKALPRQKLPRLRIFCLGNFRVYVGDRLIEEGEWQRKKAKSLLKYIATSRDHTVTRDEVVELFWGDLEPEAAKAGLRRALHVLRRLFEPHSKGYFSSYITSEHGLLTLRPEVIDTIDVDEFRQHIAAAQKAEQLGDLERARREYEALQTGDFLTDDPYEEWTIAKRERFRTLYLSAQEKLAKWRIDAGEDEAAVIYLQRILAEDCAREDIHVLLMQCLARIGRRREALAQYAACRRALKLELDVEPTPETQALYAKLLGGTAV